MHESPMELQADCVFLYELSRFRFRHGGVIRTDSVFCDSGVQFHTCIWNSFINSVSKKKLVETKRRPQITLTR